MARKQPAAEEAQPVADAPVLPARSRLAALRPVAMLVIVVGFVVGGYALWRKFSGEIVANHGPQYLLEASGIELSPAPPWIKADVRAEVYFDSGWDKQKPSILEPDLTIRVAQAFEQHTWVAKVTRVTKHHPARVVVELKYRRPAAMVEVDYHGQSGLLPVDTEGVLLPPDDFVPEDAKNYPRIAVDYTGPSGSVGTPWGDARVEAAARIAARLTDVWRECGLYRIVVEAATQPASVLAPSFSLTTRNKSRIVWGHAPGQEAAGEATFEQKLARLKNHTQQPGFDKATPSVLDVRDAQRVSLRPAGAPN
jgi:hypothetical protein